MKALFWLLAICAVTSAAAQQEQVSIRDLKGGRYKADSSYVYALPYRPGSAYLLVQAYQSKFSHKGSLALDFKMKTGTTVCAARAGLVVATRSDSDRGGLKPEMLSEGNYIFIEHDDGSVARYWHFETGGVLVSVGDTVLKGQEIGRSGNTGYSAFRHLHFEVWHPEKGQLPTRFNTKKGTRYLRAGKWHKAV